MEGTKLRVTIVEADGVTQETINRLLDVFLPQPRVPVAAAVLPAPEVKPALPPPQTMGQASAPARRPRARRVKAPEPEPTDEKTAEQRVARVVQRRPVNDAGLPITHHAGGRPPVVLECHERRGRTFTVKEAAELAGVSVSAVHSKILTAKRKGLTDFNVGEFTFRRITPRTSGTNGNAPADLGETRPRSRGAEIINPNLRGRAAHIQHGERPTPPEIAAD